MTDLSMDFAGVNFKNPIVVASGNVTRSLYSVEKCIEAGASGISTKGITYEDRHLAYPRPSIWLYDKYGDPGSGGNIESGYLTLKKGIDLIKEIKPLAKKEDVVIIANMMVLKHEEKPIQNAARELEAAGADMIEINHSCPIMVALENVIIDDWEKRQSEFVRILKNAVDIPIVLKTGPSRAPKLEGIEQAGVDAYTLLASPALATVIDIETGKPVIPGVPRYHGAGLNAFANYQTYKFATRTKLPIMSSGGIMTGRDAIERLMCGATLDAIQTAVMHRGHGVLRQMVDELSNFMERKGYERVKDFKGIAMPHIENKEEFVRFVKDSFVSKDAMEMKIDLDKCNGCGLCVRVCTNNAIKLEGDSPKRNPELCEICGICQTVCPTNAITIKRKQR